MTSLGNVAASFASIVFVATATTNSPAAASAWMRCNAFLFSESLMSERSTRISAAPKNTSSCFPPRAMSDAENLFTALKGSERTIGYCCLTSISEMPRSAAARMREISRIFPLMRHSATGSPRFSTSTLELSIASSSSTFFSRPSGRRLASSILAIVSVPVLSVRIKVVLPSASAATSLRMTPLRCAIRCTPIARITVSATGRPSGTAATATATEVMNMSANECPE